MTRTAERTAGSAAKPRTKIRRTPEQTVRTKKKGQNFYNYGLLLSVLILTGFGLLMLYSASGFNADKAMAQFIQQGRYDLAGAGIMVAISVFFDYHWLRKLGKFGYWTVFGLVIISMIFGISSHGSSRWMKLFGSSFQPSEFMKFLVIVQIANAIDLNEGGKKRMAPFAIFLIGAIPALIIARNNLSTSLIILAVSFGLLFISCKNNSYFLMAALLAALLYVFALPIARMLSGLHIFKEYQLRRIFYWKEPVRYPDKAFQTLQGLYAIGSGGFVGKGLGESVQKFLIPEAKNDMIFSIICEELGAVGAMFVLIIYAIIVWQIYDIAKNAKDLFGSLLAAGVMLHVAVQVIFNIGVSTNLFPNTGVSLPFISSGGSSVVSLMIEMGFCLNVSRQITLEDTDEG